MYSVIMLKAVYKLKIVESIGNQGKCPSLQSLDFHIFGGMGRVFLNWANAWVNEQLKKIIYELTAMIQELGNLTRLK